jgi:hypothetical protein
MKRHGTTDMEPPQLYQLVTFNCDEKGRYLKTLPGEELVYCPFCGAEL